MCWLPKTHKASNGARVILALKNCNSKSLSDVISRVFKRCLTMLKVFIEKVSFTNDLKNFGL